MEIQGIITAIAGVQKGTSAQTGNEWKTASYVVNIVNPTNSGSMVIDVKDGRDGRIAKLNLQVGKLYKLYIAFETNQWNGKYYNRIVCWGAREQSMTTEDAENLNLLAHLHHNRTLHQQQWQSHQHQHLLQNHRLKAMALSTIYRFNQTQKL